MDEGKDVDRIEVLIQIMANGDEEDKQKAGKRLVKIGEPAIPALSEALKSDKAGLRESAAIVLALIGEKAIPAVGELMKSENPETKLSAMLALAMIRSEMEEKMAGGKRADPYGSAGLEGRDMGGEAVAAPRFVKPPVKSREDATLRFRPQRRSG